MGRNFTKSWASRLQDDEFCEQHDVLEKLLFLVLQSHTECDNAGLGRVTVRRWVRIVAPATEADIWDALARLERTGEVFVDAATEEFLVREFMHDDEVGRKPNILINAARSAALVRSPKLASVLLAELQRVDVHRPANAEMATRLDAALVAAEEHLRERAARLPAPAPEPFGEPFTGRVPGTLPGEGPKPANRADSEPFGEGFDEPCVAGAVAAVRSPSVSSPIEKNNHLTQPSYVPRAREPRTDSDSDHDPGRPPPGRHRSRPPATATAGEHACGHSCGQPCGDCADAARARIAVVAERTADRQGCSWCDHHGHRHEPPELVALGLPVVVCDHTAYSVADWQRHAPRPSPGDGRVPVISEARRNALDSTKRTTKRTQKRSTNGIHHVRRRRDHGRSLAS
ncbi:hypothetical protein IU459_27180 [Nocardia amamiensis]|uniref:DUF222 domain-containing protein n=1 Tax=Nocardia amamiensis TaxID=404578 RepID=A0ABS0CXJ3_9NOCA|nr:hypothetical protein [Nocardia amamiensis]MBF6301200.1 hypothetical protein [Nocardia amamiensis]